MWHKNQWPVTFGSDYGLFYKQTPNYKKKGIRSARKTKGKRRTTSGAVLMKSGRNMLKSAPVARGMTRKGGYGLSFGPAPYEETLGEGLRLHATMLTGPINRMGKLDSGAGTNKIFTGYEGVGTTSAICTQLWTSTYTTVGGSYSLWQTNATYSSPLQSMIHFFSKFNVRKMKVTYVPLVSTAIGGSLALAASFENGDVKEENDYTSISGLTKSMRTPLWQSNSFLAIDDHDMNRPATRLYDTEMNTEAAIWQMALVGAVDSLPTTADIVGHLELEIVMDLYQFKRIQASHAVELKEAKSKNATEVAVRYPTMEEDYVHCNVSQSSSSVISVRAPSSVSDKGPGKVIRA